MTTNPFVRTFEIGCDLTFLGVTPVHLRCDGEIEVMFAAATPGNDQAPDFAGALPDGKLFVNDFRHGVREIDASKVFVRAIGPEPVAVDAYQVRAGAAVPW